MVSATSSRSASLGRLTCFVLAGVALSAVSGRLAVHQVNDSPSYVDYPFGSLQDALLSIRTPGYPLILAAVAGIGGLKLVPLVQVGLHCLSSWMFGEELIRRGLSIKSSLAATFCVLVGCTPTDHINSISTDAVAASLGVITVTLLMRSLRTASMGDATFCMLAGILCIFVRPAYLFLIAWIPFAGWLLVRRQQAITVEAKADTTKPISYFRALAISAGMASVLLAWMCMRLLVVSDFGLVPFGHQNLSAILVQTVTPETLRKLPDQNRLLGQQVAESLEQRGFETPTEQSKHLPTMTIERQWDSINYSVVWPAAKSIERDQAGVLDDAPVAEPIRVHNRIASLNHSILRENPSGYLRWLLLALRRAAWGTAANIAMHPFFLALILLGLIRLVWMIANRELRPLHFPQGWADYAIVAITYAAFGIGFVVLSTPPLGRFADANAIFLPGLIASLFVPGDKHGR